MIKSNNTLIINRGITPPVACHDAAINNDNSRFINELILNAGQLPLNPPLEIHPYKSEFPLQQFEKYIIGTFPPISYVLNHMQVVAAGIQSLSQPVGAGGNNITQPLIPFYHGNRGSMWDFLLTPAQMAALTALLQGPNGRQQAKQYLIHFLLEHRINYADIIDSAQRSLNNQNRYTASDSNLYNICINKDLICHILTNPHAKHLLFNTASIFGGAGLQTQGNGMVNVNTNTKSFDLFIRQCQELGLELAIRIQNGNPATQFNWTTIQMLNSNKGRNKLVFELRLKNPANNKKLSCNFEPGAEKILTVVTGPSPATIALLGLSGNVNCDEWLKANPRKQRRDFIQWIYQDFRNNSNHLVFYAFNR
jgi:hypothetical protein